MRALYRIFTLYIIIPQQLSLDVHFMQKQTY